MAPIINTSKNIARVEHRLGFSADGVAIGLALVLAVLIRFNVIHHIGW